MASYLENRFVKSVSQYLEWEKIVPSRQQQIRRPRRPQPSREGK